MKKNRSVIQSIALSIVFLAVSIAVYLKNVPRIVDFIGVLVCGFAAGVLLCRGITQLKSRD